MLLHAVVQDSRVNGPGVRSVVYFQGCSLRCPSCWNPETHAFTGEERSVTDVADLVFPPRGTALDGVTFSGGEPMQQADALLALIQCLRRRQPTLSFGMYSGYSLRELTRGCYQSRAALAGVARRDLWERIRDSLDFAVLGRYVAGRPSNLALRTSTNQSLMLVSDRYRECDFNPQEVEVHIAASGLVQVTGFPITGTPV